MPPVTRRRYGRAAVVAGVAASAAISAVFVALMVAWWPQGSDNVATMSDGVYASLAVGETRTSIESRYGKPDTGMDTSALPSAAPGQECVFYTESDSLMDPYLFQLCYLDGKLVSKSEFDSLTDPTPIPSSPGCVPVTLELRLQQGSVKPDKVITTCANEPGLSR